MKKWLIAIIVLIVTVALGFGSVFLIKKAKDKNKPDEIKYEISYLASEYVVGDNMVYSVRAFSNKQLESITYSIDNNKEVSVTVSAGNTKEAEQSNGKYIVDSGTELISLSTLDVGEHLIKFYVYDEDGTRYALGKAYLFTISGTNK